MLRRKKRAGLSRDGISDGKCELKKYFLLCYKNATNFFNPFSKSITVALFKILTELSDGIIWRNSYQTLWRNSNKKTRWLCHFLGTFFSTNFNRPISIFIYPSLTFFLLSLATYYRPYSVWTCSSQLVGLISTVAFFIFVQIFLLTLYCFQ